MSEKPKSVAVFNDGHEEEITYLREFSNCVEFATESGFYVFKGPELERDGIINPIFYKLEAEDVHTFYRTTVEPKLIPISSINAIRIDERISVKYKVKIGNICRENDILVPPRFSDLEIKNEILKDSGVDIQYEKHVRSDIHVRRI